MKLKERKISKITTVLLIIFVATILSGCSDNPLATNELERAENAKDPGFETVFAIIILLAVMYLVRWKKEKKAQKKEHDERGYE